MLMDDVASGRFTGKGANGDSNQCRTASVRAFIEKDFTED